MSWFIKEYRFECIAIFACLGLMVLVLELVRRGEIKEKYSFLWFLTGGSLLILTFKRSWLTSLSETLGIFYPPSALFLVLIFFMILILIHFSMVLSRLITQNQKLAQKIALLEFEINSARSHLNEP